MHFTVKFWPPYYNKMYGWPLLQVLLLTSLLWFGGSIVGVSSFIWSGFTGSFTGGLSSIFNSFTGEFFCGETSLLSIIFSSFG